jgi:hypothetical protein
MTDDNNTSAKPANIGVAAIGGGGIGTIVVGLAQLLPETSHLRGFWITIAPALSVGISSAWLWATAQIEQYRINVRKDKVVADTKAYLLSVINDPKATDERRDQASKQLLILEEKHFRAKIQVLDEPNNA